MRVVRAGSNFVEAGARALARPIEECLARRERVSFAVSGGSTPCPVFRLLAQMPLDWGRVDIYQVDERVAPAGDPARNLTGLTEALLDRVAAIVHPMPVEASNLDAAAVQYGAELPSSLDVVHLGLGDDGHTASLVPGDPVLDVTDRPVAVSRPYQGHRRMTLTFPVLACATRIVWLVAGANKASMLERLRAGDQRIPAGRVHREHAVLVTDELAGS
ncbi:MAG: 6-phosphogluconolactonase [Polyangiales bacterium]